MSGSELAGRARVLLVDDEYNVLVTLARVLKRQGFELVTEINPIEALRLIETQVREAGRAQYDAVLVDLKMPEMDGTELLDAVHQLDPTLPVIVLTGFGTIRSAVDATRRGAFDYLVKPSSPEEIAAVLRRAVARPRSNAKLDQDQGTPLGAENEETVSPAGFVANSPKMQHLLRQIQLISKSSTTVLLHGESGTGKELLAREIHRHGPRAGQPFVAVNCAALPVGLAESLLFGHRRGAFTGAERDHHGYFLAANGGVLFLDEVGDLPGTAQALLLRALQERVITPIGAPDPVPIDIHLISATHRALSEEVLAGRFRADLMYRLAVVELEVPPLRERSMDLVPLVESILAEICGEGGVLELGPDVIDLLQRHSWPGNVRELRNVIERAVVLAQGTVIGAADLPPYIGGARAGAIAPSQTDLDNERTLDALERRHIEAALLASGGMKTVAARRLGIDRKRLYRKMKRLGLIDGPGPSHPD